MTGGSGRDLTYYFKEHSMTMLRAAGSFLRRLLPPGWAFPLALALTLMLPLSAYASELDLQLPTLDAGQRQLLFIGLGVCVLGMLFGLVMFNRVKGMPAHQSMLNVSAIIYETCKTYLLQQGRLLLVLEAFIAACIVYYFG